MAERIQNGADIACRGALHELQRTRGWSAGKVQMSFDACLMVGDTTVDIHAGRSAGALFIRSYERGERVHLAMLARGYTGAAPRTTGPEPR